MQKLFSHSISIKSKWPAAHGGQHTVCRGLSVITALLIRVIRSTALTNCPAVNSVALNSRSAQSVRELVWKQQSGLINAKSVKVISNFAIQNCPILYSPTKPPYDSYTWSIVDLLNPLINQHHSLCFSLIRVTFLPQVKGTEEPF